MTPLQKNIMAVLMGTMHRPLDAGEITLHVNENRHRVQAELHILDDDGLVTMRNGFYKPSAAYRKGEHETR